VFLTNITMETYFQWGAQEACNMQEGVPKTAKCLSPPSVPDPSAHPAIWTTPVNNSKTPIKPGVHTNIFGTESCMGCHSSAGIYTSYDPLTKTGKTSGQLTGDFSWLMSQKANYYKGQ
jgi:hypothetical protein